MCIIPSIRFLRDGTLFTRCTHHVAEEWSPPCAKRAKPQNDLSFSLMKRSSYHMSYILILILRPASARPPRVDSLFREEQAWCPQRSISRITALYRTVMCNRSYSILSTQRTQRYCIHVCTVHVYTHNYYSTIVTTRIADAESEDRTYLIVYLHTRRAQQSERSIAYMYMYP